MENLLFIQHRLSLPVLISFRYQVAIGGLEEGDDNHSGHTCNSELDSVQRRSCARNDGGAGSRLGRGRWDDRAAAAGRDLESAGGVEGGGGAVVVQRGGVRLAQGDGLGECHGGGAGGGGVDFGLSLGRQGQSWQKDGREDSGELHFD
jgi:hypothetical protein